MILLLALLASPRAVTETSCFRAQRSQGEPRWNAVRRTAGRLALTVATCLIAACAATRALDAAAAARPVNGGTAMLYLPARAGRLATILSYDLGRGRSGTSAVGLLRRRAEAADVAGHPTGDRPCDEGGCLVTKPQVYRLAATPASAINRALMLIRNHLPISKEALESGLGASEGSTGEQVVVGVQIEGYICGINGEAIPPDLLLPVCGDRAIIHKITISGQPGVKAGTVFSAGDAAFEDKHWYRFSQLRSDADRLGISLTDVTRNYDMHWPYHLPSMANHFKVEGCANCLAVAVIGAGRNPAGSWADVIRLNIYF